MEFNNLEPAHNPVDAPGKSPFQLWGGTPNVSLLLDGSLGIAMFEETQGARGMRIREIVIGLVIGGVALAAVILFGLEGSIITQSTDDASPAKAGMPAPGFVLPTSAGQSFSLAEARGRPVWLTFWATWCPPCRVEMPDLQRAYEKSAPGRYEYVAVNSGESVDVVRSYLLEIGYTLPVAIDPSAGITVTYGVLNLPTHIFIDADGIVQEVYAGALSRSQIAERVGKLW